VGKILGLRSFSFLVSSLLFLFGSVRQIKLVTQFIPGMVRISADICLSGVLAHSRPMH